MVQFASYLRRVLCKPRLIFPRINGPNMKAIRWRLHLTVNHMFNGFFYNALTAKSELNLIMPSKFKYRVESV